VNAPRARLIYSLALAACFASVAAARFDLVQSAFDATRQSLAQGGTVRLKILGEIVLLGGILLAVLLVIPQRMHPVRDTASVILACAAGYFAEAWGARNGLWKYYTSERPPLWIVPAWPLGALLVDRLAARAQALAAGLLGARGHAAGYWILSACALAVFCWFVAGKLLLASSLLVLAALSAALAAAADYRRDFWIFTTASACVFFAELWGTTNHCWSYHTQSGGAGALPGICFGMLFDAAIVLGCLKLARLAAPDRAWNM